MEVQDIFQEAKKLQPKLEKIRRDLHSHPETGFEIPYTKNLVLKELKEIGYQPKEVGKSGIVVIAGGKKPGPCILLRADMDALPLNDETDLEFKSLNLGKMHACGHDMHTTMLLGVAEILKKHEDEINGYVKMEFQPAEEIFQGSLDMIENGLLDNPPVEAALMIHVMTGSPMDKGTILFSEGGISSASHERYTIIVKGKGGHGSTPFKAIDPITTAAYIHIALSDIRTRQMDPGSYGVFSTGIFKSGSAANAIPETAEMAGTIRTLDPSGKINEEIKEKIAYISKHIGEAFHCEVEVKFSDYCPCMVVNKELSDFAEKSLKELPDKKVQRIKTDGAGGSEDFSFVSLKVPTLALYLGAGDSREGFTYPIHNPKTMFDDSILYKGCAVFVKLALDWLNSKN